MYPKGVYRLWTSLPNQTGQPDRYSADWLCRWPAEGLSDGRAYVRIGEFTAPIVGRICMDQLAVDITDAPGAAVGDIATLVNNRKDGRISAPRIAEQAGSISNELLSRMGNRLPIVIKE